MVQEKKQNKKMDQIWKDFDRIRLENKKKKNELKSTPLFDSFDIEGAAKLIEKSKNIIVLTGAGISVAAGIPDFRSPKTGLYSRLKKYKLPTPESIFTLKYYKRKPEPFTMLASELFPSNKHKPTKVHQFIKLLEDKKMLKRNYTQNIDCLERKVGLSDKVLVECHGSFASATCLKCEAEYTQEYMKKIYDKKEVPYCTECLKGLIKPDIVFFGESLYRKYYVAAHSNDFDVCDLMIIIGTSLKVAPVSTLIDKVHYTCPRILINKEKVYNSNWLGQGFHFDEQFRDCFLEGDCQKIIESLCKELKWDLKIHCTLNKKKIK